MTEELLTEDQEAERAKQWLRENFIYLAAGVLFGLGGLFGWQGWKDYQQGQAVEASVVWQQLTEAIAGERFNEVDQTLALLESDYAATPYLDQARLSMARLYMDRSDFDGALQQLQTLQQEGRDPLLREIAVLRQAQILIAKDQAAEALELLSPEPRAGMAALRWELRGDALFAQGEFSAARDAYQNALNNDPGSSLDRNFVQMKIDDVAVSLSSVSEGQSPEELPALDALPDDSAIAPAE